VWVRSNSPEGWGWKPAIISNKETITQTTQTAGRVTEREMVRLTLRDDANADDSRDDILNFSMSGDEIEIFIDPTTSISGEIDEVKLRNVRNQSENNIDDGENTGTDGDVNDLIDLPHLHEPAILHALRMRYDNDIIYTATGPILIAVNPFKAMGLYDASIMEDYRRAGENSGESKDNLELPPHAYKTADEAYRAMMRGLEDRRLMGNTKRPQSQNGDSASTEKILANQSILVSGESGAGKTVTTKIILNYFAVLSRMRANDDAKYRLSKRNSNDRGSTSRRNLIKSNTSFSTMNLIGTNATDLPHDSPNEEVSIEGQVLQSNPILESFGNARTNRNDNSSRFGKYIDVRFNPTGKLAGAQIETYLLEKVRLIHIGHGERNYHIFYQFLAGATDEERKKYMLDKDTSIVDFDMLNQSGTFDRRDRVSDKDNHFEMLEAMETMGFLPETIQSLMQLVVSILFIGNMVFESSDPETGEEAYLVKDHTSVSAASLLGVPFEGLAEALTTRNIMAGAQTTVKKLFTIDQAVKAKEALIKAVYGAAFDFVVKKINNSIKEEGSEGSTGASSRNLTGMSNNAYIGVLDIFGFESFQINNFEQLCINYTNEALQQQFNKYVFKLEQQEYEKEGILWKYISFPDNQDVLDLIDAKHIGLLAILDEQCMVAQGREGQLAGTFYNKCSKHVRFVASSTQRVNHKFSIDHYAGLVEYSTENWLEKNKDELPAASAELLSSSSFKILGQMKEYFRIEDKNAKNKGGIQRSTSGRVGGSVATKSVGAQFAAQLKVLRKRIDTTTPHYIRCLKPNDDLIPDWFDPRNIVDQLRCGGVLEAVRVSRAGYPTRYPHDVFLARYYILAENNDENRKVSLAPEKKLRMMERKKKGSNPSRQRKDLTPQKLVEHIAFNIWRSESSTMELLLKSMQNGGDSTAHPETVEDFWKLDFPTRCAMAGLQLGRTKVFLRREAFDCIEAMRSQKFAGSACIIQTMVRGRQQLKQYRVALHSIIVMQSVARIAVAQRRCALLKLDKTAAKIQSIWRMFCVRDQYMYIIDAVLVIQRGYRTYKLGLLAPASAILIQSFVRGHRVRMNFDRFYFSVVSLQALWRGRNAREEILILKSKYPSKAKTRRKPNSSYGVFPSGKKHPDVDKVALTNPFRRPEKSLKHKTVDERFTRNVPVVVDIELGEARNDLYRFIQDENWAMVENMFDKTPELAEEIEPTSGELPLHIIARHVGAWTLLIDMVLVLYPKALVHHDNMGALPIHHAAAHDSLAALEIIYSAYKDGINDVDLRGRLPLHVASEYDAVEAVKFLLEKAPEGAYTMVHRPPSNSGGGLPLHVACRNFASIGVITALLAENFASAKRADENGDLPLHLLLRCGEQVDQVIVKTLLTCFSAAVNRTDMNGDLPLTISLKHKCSADVVNTLILQFPSAAGILDSDGHSPLFLAFRHDSDDRTILGLLNHAPEHATQVDRMTGLLPVQVATEHEHSHFIVHNLLKRDMPIDLKEKVRAQLLPHHYSWNHVVSNTNDMYHQVVAKLLQQCTQPQVLALAHVEGADGRIALASATPVCKHELRVMLRLFNTLEVVNQRPAYTNPESDTQIFYALRYEPPSHAGSGAFTVLHEDKGDDALGDHREDLDDASQISGMSNRSMRSSRSTRSQLSIEEKIRNIRKEKGQQVIAKLTSRSHVVERELKVRKEFRLSRHYVPAIISVHHTVQHAAYSEAMAEPGYCITMEGADTTAENMMLDLRKAGKKFPVKALKRIGISLLHMHEHGIIHGDFGTHNIGKFGSRWKLLGVGGAIEIGSRTDQSRGFYHPPESINVTRRSMQNKKDVNASVVSIGAHPTYDIWAFGVAVYEAVVGQPLPPYACRGKRAMSEAEVGKIGRWDDHYLRKALKVLDSQDNEVARDVIKRVLHYDPMQRVQSMREILNHSFFAENSEGKVLSPKSYIQTPKSYPSKPRSGSIPKQSVSDLRDTFDGSDGRRPPSIPRNSRTNFIATSSSVTNSNNGDNAINGSSAMKPHTMSRKTNSSSGTGNSFSPNRNIPSFDDAKSPVKGFSGLRKTLRTRRVKKVDG